MCFGAFYLVKCLIFTNFVTRNYNYFNDMEEKSSLDNNCEYIFDESQSLFNITKDEYNLVIDLRQSPEKLLLIERLRYIIQHEYGKYCNSTVNNAPFGEDFGTYFQNLWNNENVLYAQEAISALVESYNSQQSRMRARLMGMDKRLLNTLEHDYWIDALMFYLMTHWTSTTAHRSLLNLINRYYSALSNLRYAQKLDTELEQQLNILYPFVFVNKNNPEAWSLTNYNFTRRTIKALYNNQERKRNDFFRLLRLLESLTYTFYQQGEFLLFNSEIDIKIKKLPSPQIEPWVLRLSKIEYQKEVVMEYTISAKTIEDIRRVPAEADSFLDYLLSEFKNNYKTYVTRFYDEWTNIIRHQAEVDGSESWRTFLYGFLKELGVNRSGKDVLEPDYCYDYIIYRHVMSRSELTLDSSILDKQLTNRLIDMLHKNKSDCQYRLYEDCFFLHYILKKINEKEDMPMRELAQDDSVWRETLEFLNPILNDSFINITVMSVEQVKRLIKIIIYNAGFYEDMRFVPETFAKYNLRVNANILLKIINLLIKTNIIKNGTPLFRTTKTTKLAAAIFNLKGKKEIDNMRKHISLKEDKHFTTNRRIKAQTIIDEYWKDITNNKK